MTHARLLAQITNPVLPAGLGSGGTQSGGQAVGSLVSGLLGAMFVFAFIFAFMYLLLGGFHWITSGGDKAHLESAKNKITHALIGLIIVAAAWAVFALMGQFFGIDVKNLPIPTIKP